MLKLNETLVTQDPAEALELEAGVFDVTSPTGERFHFVVRPGRSISNIRYQAESKTQAAPPQWRVKKIGELRTE